MIEAEVDEENNFDWKNPENRALREEAMLDMTNFLRESLYERVGEEEFIKNDPELYGLMEKAFDAISDLYQAIALKRA